MDTSSELAVETADTHEGSANDVAAGSDDPDARHTTVRLVGTLTVTNAPGLAARLCGELTTHGAVVADASALVVEDAVAVHAFADAVLEAGEWPDVRLALATGDRETVRLLAASRVDQRVVVRPDVAAAVAALGERPDLVRAFWYFDISEYAPGTARAHVRRVCGRWAVDAEVCEAAEIVVTELVTNAVEHASSRSLVEVERRANAFRMTVRDYDTSSLPEAVLPPPSSSRGRGLAMVAAVSREWGVHHHTDGKTVWAEMATA